MAEIGDRAVKNDATLNSLPLGSDGGMIAIGRARAAKDGETRRYPARRLIFNRDSSRQPATSHDNLRQNRDNKTPVELFWDGFGTWNDDTRRQVTTSGDDSRLKDE